MAFLSIAQPLDICQPIFIIVLYLIMKACVPLFFFILTFF